MSEHEITEEEQRLEHALERCEAAGSPAYAELAAKEVRRLQLALRITKEAAHKIEQDAETRASSDPVAASPLSIYVASSWRNPLQPEVVGALRRAGHDVYDFRNPAPGDRGFSWRQCEGAPEGRDWNASDARRVLHGEVAQRGYGHDFRGMAMAAVCVLVLPSGRSAHLEAGWFTGRHQPLIVLSPIPQEPELMYLLGGGVIVSNIDEVLAELAKLDVAKLGESEPGFSADEWRTIARSLGVPGPDVGEHPEGYEGECYCAECLTS